MQQVSASAGDGHGVPHWGQVWGAMSVVFPPVDGAHDSGGDVVLAGRGVLGFALGFARHERGVAAPVGSAELAHVPGHDAASFMACW